MGRFLINQGWIIDSGMTCTRKTVQGPAYGHSMAELPFKNTYDLSPEQLLALDEAEEMMERLDLGAAETAFLVMLDEAPDCIPVLNNLGHLYGKLLSEFEKAVEYYEKVLQQEPDNAWARDQRRRYLRYCSYD